MQSTAVANVNNVEPSQGHSRRKSMPLAFMFLAFCFIPVVGGHYLAVKPERGRFEAN